MLVTHEPEVAAFCGRIVVFRDGHLLSDRVSEHPESAEEALKQFPADPLADLVGDTAMAGDARPSGESHSDQAEHGQSEQTEKVA